MHLGCTACSGRRREGALRAAARDARANGELEQAKRTVVHVEGTSVHGTRCPRKPLMHGRCDADRCNTPSGGDVLPWLHVTS